MAVTRIAQTFEANSVFCIEPNIMGALGDVAFAVGRSGTTARTAAEVSQPLRLSLFRPEGATSKVGRPARYFVQVPISFITRASLGFGPMTSIVKAFAASMAAAARRGVGRLSECWRATSCARPKGWEL